MKVEFSNGAQDDPFNPHPLLAAQYVDVHEMKESAGVWKDCAREKNAMPMIQAAPRISRIHGEVSGCVARIR